MKKKFLYVSLLLGLCICFIEPVYAVDYVSCGGVDDIPEALPTFVSNSVNNMKLWVPIIIIVMGMIDFGRAVMASDEKQMKESQSRFIRRIISGIMVFLTFAIVQFVFRQLKDYKLLNCMNCFINGDCNGYSENADQPACYFCGSQGGGEYHWATKNPSVNSCKKVDKTKEECGGACYFCDSSTATTYRWAQENPNVNNCKKVDKTKEECGGGG